MKKLVIMLFFILGMMAANAQGYLGISLQQLDKIFYEKSSLEKAIIRVDVKSAYIVHLRDYSWTFLINDDNMVYESAVTPTTSERLTEMVNEIILDYVRVGKNNFVEYYSWGVVHIDIVEIKPDKLPVIRFTYEYY